MDSYLLKNRILSKYINKSSQDILDRAFLTSAVVKQKIIEGLKEIDISVIINDDIVTFKRGKYETRKGLGLLDLEDSDSDDDSLHSIDYVEYVVNHIKLTIQEMEG